MLSDMALDSEGRAVCNMYAGSCINACEKTFACLAYMYYPFYGEYFRQA